MNLGVVRSRPWRAFQRVERSEAQVWPKTPSGRPARVRAFLTALAERGVIQPGMTTKAVHQILLKDMGRENSPPYGLMSPETVRRELRTMKGFETGARSRRSP